MRDCKGKLLLIFKVFSAIFTIFVPQSFEDDMITFASFHLLMLRKGSKIPATKTFYFFSMLEGTEINVHPSSLFHVSFL